MSRAAVYAAEDQWSAVLDRGGVVDFFGSRLDVPQQRRFADVASIQRYVDGVLALPSVAEAYPHAGPVTVRERGGQTKAHYEPGTATIAVPLQSTWAGREAVVLHELSHHLCAGSEADWHGPRYRLTMCHVVECVLGAPAALLLRAGYEESGVAVGVIP